MAIKVVELFAGVGGFRIGLEGYPKRSGSPFEVVWSNQFEPSTTIQHANRVYKTRWPNANHSDRDISTVPTSEIPDHDLLVGGFPCQDYSVASTLKNLGGLIGKKGVLWWQIHRILKEKGKKAPKYLLLENVDRLLKSPASQRGRDFAIMLSSLDQLGYAVEWRVINAAEYGMPQRRKRVFILGYRKGTKAHKRLSTNRKPENQLLRTGVFAQTFPVGAVDSIHSDDLDDDLVKLSEEFNRDQKHSPFQNSGFMANGKFHTLKTVASYKDEKQLLKDVLLGFKFIPKEFFIDPTELHKWEYLKGAKREKRFNRARNFHYDYMEGSMTFPDALDRPSRTVITAEGGASASRFKHVVLQKGKLRRLTPVELERLNMFPDNHTQMEGVTDSRRAFFMGNALVIGIIEKLGNRLAKEILG